MGNSRESGCAQVGFSEDCKRRACHSQEVVVEREESDAVIFNKVKMVLRRDRDRLAVGGRDPYEAPPVAGPLTSFLDHGAEQDRRPPFFVELLRSGPQWSHLGLTLSPDPIFPALLVEEVLTPSLVSEWNDTQPNHQVMVGDVIKAVNNQDGNGSGISSGDMVKELTGRTQKGDALLLLIA